MDRLLPESRLASKVGTVVAVVLAVALGFVFRDELGEFIAGDHGAAGTSAPTTFYTCSMDPSVESDHPGACPICGMALTPVTQQERSSGVVRVASKARAMIGLDVAAVEKRTFRRRTVASGVIVEPAAPPAAASRPAAAPHRVVIAVRVYRGDASDARRGEPVTVTTRDVALMVFNGTVAEPAADGSAALQIAVDDPEKLLRPGMLVEATVETELDPRLAVPSTAVLYAGKRRIVFVARSNGTFEPRTPPLGVTADGLVEVLSGLDEGEQVAISGTFLLAAESRIRSDGALWEDRPPPAPVKPAPPTTPSPASGW
jgi:hypothetical protein